MQSIKKIQQIPKLHKNLTSMSINWLFWSFYLSFLKFSPSEPARFYSVSPRSRGFLRSLSVDVEPSSFTAPAHRNLSARLLCRLYFQPLPLSPCSNAPPWPPWCTGRRRSSVWRSSTPGGNSRFGLLPLPISWLLIEAPLLQRCSHAIQTEIFSSSNTFKNGVFQFFFSSNPDVWKNLIYVFS